MSVPIPSLLKPSAADLYQKIMAGTVSITTINVNEKMRHDITFLHYVAEQGNLPLVCSLVAEGALPNVVDEAWFTPLIRSIFSKYFEVAKALLDFGARVTIRDRRGQCVLGYMAQHGANALIPECIMRGADIDFYFKDHSISNRLSPLSIAVKHGQHQCALTLLEYGANTKVITYYKEDVELLWQHTLLYMIINGSNRIPLVDCSGDNKLTRELLLEIVFRNPDFNVIDDEMMTPEARLEAFNKPELALLLKMSRLLRPDFLSQEHLQRIANLAELEYLKANKDDHLLTYDRAGLRYAVRVQVTEAVPMLSELPSFRMALKTLIEQINAELKAEHEKKRIAEFTTVSEDAVKLCIPDLLRIRIMALLFPRKEILFFQPYKEALHFKDASGELALPLPAVIIDVIINYFVQNSPSSGFSKDDSSPYGSQKTENLSLHLFNERIRFLQVQLEERRRISSEARALRAGSSATMAAIAAAAPAASVAPAAVAAVPLVFAYSSGVTPQNSLSVKIDVLNEVLGTKTRDEIFRSHRKLIEISKANFFTVGRTPDEVLLVFPNQDSANAFADFLEIRKNRITSAPTLGGAAAAAAPVTPVAVAFATAKFL